MLRALPTLLLALTACSGAIDTSAPKSDAARSRDSSEANQGSSTAERDAAAAVRDAVRDGGALVAPSSLPACNWPASLDPHAPDGSIAGWAVGRSVLACGPQILDGGAWGAFGISADGGTSLGVNATLNGDTTCIMGCALDDYAVAEGNWYGYPPPDAAIVRPILPVGCTGEFATFETIVERAGTAEPLPNVYCCPCE